MSVVTKIVIIWGAAILLFIAVSKNNNTSGVLNSFSGFVSGTTATLQGRNSKTYG